MLARLGFLHAAFVVLLLCVVVGWSQTQAIADPPLLLRDYRFITDKSTVDVTGGFAGVDWQFNVLGRLGLVTGYNEESGGPTAHAPSLIPYAAFTDLNAILFDPRRATPLPSPGWDLDQTLNLSGLKGTFSVPDNLFFLGADGQGQALRIEATVSGRLLHLTGGTSDPLCCDFFRYRVDAWAHQLPWADFNGSGSVDAADYSIWQQSYGATVDPGTAGDANGDGVVDATDYALWRSQLEQSDATLGGTSSVPEPGTPVMLILGAAPLGVLADLLRSDNCTRAR